MSHTSNIQSSAIWVIAGPTASGKSQLALRMARENNGCILNADSVQVYRDLHILSARPSPADEKIVPHYGYGFLNPDQIFSAGAWRSWALEQLSQHSIERKSIFIVGGTGLYLKALLHGFLELPVINPIIRQKLECELQLHGKAYLYQQLEQQDPFSAAKIAPQDLQRTLRALEVLYGTGQPIHYWQSNRMNHSGFTLNTVLIMPKRDELEILANNRIDKMVAEGAIDEIKTLISKNFYPPTPIYRALGALAFYQYIQGKMTCDEAISQTKLQTRQYIKRQYTWFRHQLKPDYIIENSEEKFL